MKFLFFFFRDCSIVHVIVVPRDSSRRLVFSVLYLCPQIECIMYFVFVEDMFDVWLLSLSHNPPWLFVTPDLKVFCSFLEHTSKQPFSDVTPIKL